MESHPETEGRAPKSFAPPLLKPISRSPRFFGTAEDKEVHLFEHTMHDYFLLPRHALYRKLRFAMC